MSFAEVEKGLPPPDSVPKNAWRRPDSRPLSVIHPTWALITPSQSSSTSNSPIAQHRLAPRTPSTTAYESESSDGGFPLQHPPKSKPLQPLPTKRYLIQDGGDDDMKVIQLDPTASVPTTLEPPNPRPKPKLSRQAKSTSLPVPTVRVTASSPTNSPSPSATALAKRAKHFIIFLLTILPPLFFTVGIHYLKFNMTQYGVSVLGLCVFQGITWPALIFLIFNNIWLKLSLLAAIRSGWLEIMVISILSPTALVLQLIALVNLDVTIFLSLTFAPLVIVAFIQHITQERSFSLELCVMALLVYLGVTLIGLSGLYYIIKSDQTDFIMGLGGSLVSLILTIPSGLLLIRLRSKEVDDSVTATSFAIVGTLICVGIGLVTGFNKNGTQIDPGTLSSVVTFIFFGTIFQFIESKLNRESDYDTESEVGNGDQSVRKQASLGRLRLSRTRLGVFFVSSLWELIKLGFNPTNIFFPSVFSIFGVLLLLVGYTLSVGYEFWLRSVKRHERIAGKSPIHRNRFLFIPWLFSRKL